MEFTDRDIPISCGECSEVVDGVEQMVSHILVTHREYEPNEAENFANIWAQDAYDEIEARDIYRNDDYDRDIE